ncbi:MAG: heavy metal-binding domain-containing protein, partial [bacterium]|nr:heavy metal-binding domain-containing protein [bacterium]
MELIAFIALVALGYFAGSLAERKHYASIESREEALLHLPSVTIRKVEDEGQVEKAQLVSGNAVISVDYFKRLLAGLRTLVGGRVKTYESLLDRARREAILRMKAQDPTADVIINLRLETSSISKGNQQKSVGTIEALAYGTAIHLK